METVESRVLLAAHVLEFETTPAIQQPTDVAPVISPAASGPVGAGLPSPKLHSLPTAKAKLFLNFYGDTVPSWAGKAPGTFPAFSVDGDRTSISAADLAAMTEIWQRVSEMYSPFNIDVTTEDPQLTGTKKEAKAEFTNMDAWYQGNNGQSGGVALRGGFSTDFGPASNDAWVFTNMLTFAGEDQVAADQAMADAAAHECGHLFGLDHHGYFNADGTPVNSSNGSSYDPGTALFGPIMGAPYDSAEALWYNDKNTDGEAQDDLAVIADMGSNGFGYHADEGGSTPKTAGNFLYSNGGLGVSVSGAIEQQSDVDYFAFTSGPGPVSFTVAPPAHAAMLDAVVKIVNAQGQTLVTVDTSPTQSKPQMPTEHLNYTIQAQGQYYLVISSHGTVKPLNNIVGGGSTPGYGYSVGSYSVTGTLPSTVPVSAVISGPTTVDEGHTITLSGENSTGSVALYEWDVNYDPAVGFIATSTGETVDISSTDGYGQSQVVALRVTDFLGNTYLATQTETQLNVAPVVSGIVPITIAENQALDQIATVYAQDVNADLPGLRYSFDFDGDGVYEVNGLTSARIQLPATYFGDAPAGGKTLSLSAKVTDKDGGTATFVIPVNVTNAPPSGTLTFPTSVAEGSIAEISLAGVSDVPADLPGIRYDFDIDGDGAYDVLGRVSPVYDYPAGTLDGIQGQSSRAFKIRATDKDGGASVYAGSFDIVNTPPVATITLPGVLATTGASMTLVGTATDPSLADTAAGFSLSWTVFSGTSAIASGSGPTFGFVPPTAGVYTASFSATDKDGGTGTTTSTFTIVDPKSVVSVTAGNPITEGQAPTVSFTITLAQAALNTVTVGYSATATGGLSLGSGFGGSAGTVTFAPGVTQVTVLIPVANDSAQNVTQGVSLRLVSPSANAVISSASSASVAVANDDASVTFLGNGVNLVGSANDDNIVVTAGRRGYTNVLFNGVLLGSYFNAKSLILDGGAGNDIIRVDASIKMPTLIFGGAGNDSITGGSGPDVLIGGAGTDSLMGNKGSNLLIADDVAFTPDSGEAAALLAAWSAKGSNARKLAGLQGPGAPLGGGSVVSDSSTDRIDVSSTSTDTSIFSGGDQRFLLKGKKSVLLA